MSPASEAGPPQAPGRSPELAAHLAAETDRLRGCWMRHSPEMLRDYLVTGQQDPRTNLQSVLIRHFLIEQVLGPGWAGLRREELRFAAVMSWLRTWVEAGAGPEELAGLEHALQKGADNAEGTPIPFFVRQAFAGLPQVVDGLTVPNYLAQALQAARLGLDSLPTDQAVLNVFMGLWRQALAREDRPRCRVLEAGCGSANDFRFIAACGLSRFLDYTGLDLCATNIANARALCAEGRFEVGNLLALGYSDQAFDCAWLQDVLEHLSAEALEVALGQLCRVTRQALCLGFFQMYEGPEHLVRPVGDYHLNRLSLPRVRGVLARHGARPHAIHIRTLLHRLLGWEDGYWDTAYTLVVRF